MRDRRAISDLSQSRALRRAGGLRRGGRFRRALCGLAVAIGRFIPEPAERHIGFEPAGLEPTGFQWESSDAMILGVAFVSGLLFFALEVIWAHLAGVVIGTSVYAFSSMLFVVLIGLARGSFEIGRKAHRGAAPTRLHGAVFPLFRCDAGAGGVLAVQPARDRVTRLHAFNFYSGEAVRLVVLMALLLPVTYAYGMIYPSLFQAKRFERPGAGVLLGYMTGANAVGCVWARWPPPSS